MSKLPLGAAAGGRCLIFCGVAVHGRTVYCTLRGDAVPLHIPPCKACENGVALKHPNINKGWKQRTFVFSSLK